MREKINEEVPSLIRWVIKPIAELGFSEGHPDSQIWIAGLNPKGPENYNDPREKDNLKNYFSGDIHPYFKDFLTVSKHLYSLLGKPKGAGHTDIVKCCSNNFPPENINIKEAEKIKENCSVYLRNQILSFKPKIIVCNGTPVCDFFIKAFPPLRNLNGIYDNDTALGPWSL